MPPHAFKDALLVGESVVTHRARQKCPVYLYYCKVQDNGEIWQGRTSTA